MKTFEYKGFDGSGVPCRGLLEAFDLKDAREKLAGRGILAEKVGQAGAGPRRWFARREAALATEARAMMYREVSALLKAGLPLAHALEVLIQAPELGENRGFLAGVRDRIREGEALAAALSTSGAAISAFEKAAVEVGERSGALDQVLDRVASFMEEQQRLRERIQTALIYPAIVLALAVVVSCVMLGVMIPQFARLLTEARMELPALTRATLAVGRAVSVAWLPLLALALAAALALRYRLRHDEGFRIAIDRRLFGLPLWGRSYTALVNLRFSRTLALLLRGGVPLVDGMLIAGRATGSPWVSDLTRRASEAVRHGSTLADAVRGIPPLGASLPGWIQAGEASGDLETLLENAGARYQQQWDRVVTRGLAVLEPVLILIVGSLVLLLALSILLPVLSLNKALI